MKFHGIEEIEENNEYEIEEIFVRFVEINSNRLRIIEPELNCFVNSFDENSLIVGWEFRFSVGIARISMEEKIEESTENIIELEVIDQGITENSERSSAEVRPRTR